MYELTGRELVRQLASGLYFITSVLDVKPFEMFGVHERLLQKEILGAVYELTGCELVRRLACGLELLTSVLNEKLFEVFGAHVLHDLGSYLLSFAFISGCCSRRYFAPFMN